MTDEPRPIGERLFTDGTTRPDFELPDGRQYVEDHVERVEGTWLPPGDEPVSVAAPNASPRTYAGVSDECCKLKRKGRPLMKLRAE